MNSKNDKIIFATKHQPPHNSHLLPFYTFDTSFTQVYVFLFVFHLYTRRSPSSDLLSYHHSTKSLFLSLTLRPPPLMGFSLRTGPLQHTQVIVLFGSPQFEEAGPTVVKFEGSTLGRRCAGEHSHYCVEVSRVAAVALCSHDGSGPSSGSTRRAHHWTTTTLPSSASLGFLQPLNLGATHRKLVEEFFRLRA